MWGILERQSLVITAERRMGKTCVMKKMVAEPPRDRLCFFRDLEGIHTPAEFAESVFRDAESHLSTLSRNAERARRLMVELGGLEIGGVLKLPEGKAVPWKRLLIATVEDLVEGQDRQITFFWDEMPLMLQNFVQQTGERTAMEVLDTIRGLRQTHERLRLVMSGSVGLHHVLTSLKAGGYANAPTNDMHTEDLPPLSPEDAQDLARELIAGEALYPPDAEATARAICEAVDCMPYFIHHVVDQLTRTGELATPERVGETVATCITDAQDRWHLHYYRERIENYYGRDDQDLALALLDVLAADDQPLEFAELFNRIKHHVATEDAEAVRDVLTLLQRDHYVSQQPDGSHRFTFPLIQRWWRMNRGV